jgi:hypothetical protein
MARTESSRKRAHKSLSGSEILSFGRTEAAAVVPASAAHGEHQQDVGKGGIGSDGDEITIGRPAHLPSRRAHQVINCCGG